MIICIGPVQDGDFQFTGGAERAMSSVTDNQENTAEVSRAVNKQISKC